MDNKYSVYRQIRYQRTYRTIGKMGPVRIILGVVLMILVLLMSGFVSQRLAAGGHFRAAEKLMISPAWMEKYKPETKAFIEAGVLYQDGDFGAAVEAFSVIEEVDAAVSMKNLSQLKLSSEFFGKGEVEQAYTNFIEIDFSLLTDEDADSYLALRTDLYNYYLASNEDEASFRADFLGNLNTEITKK